jgi:hypothetical protein
MKKAPPFKQRLQAAVEVARAAGAARVQVKTCDGATIDIDLRPDALGETTNANDFDTKPPRRGRQ